MQICHFNLPDKGAQIGLVNGGIVFNLTASKLPEFASLTSLLQASVVTPIHELVQRTRLSSLPAFILADLNRSPAEGGPYLLPPVDRQEVWAAGVTYDWSREARERESQSKNIYTRVYEAERPELFFKSIAEKVVGPNEWVGLRSDSHWNVPEPELAIVLNPRMQIVGYTIGNDMSSRDIEGENPLYLPQAKIYRHACALGPVITLASEGLFAQSLAVYITVYRVDASQLRQIVYQGNTSTAKMHRKLETLISYLARDNDFPYGVVLLTGTGLVPGDEFTLQNGDEVQIEIDSIGILRNFVRQM
jgi:2-dehydro-3-deoxy-D-arabinonate dehydratase